MTRRDVRARVEVAASASLPAPGPILLPVELPLAPPVVRAVSIPLRRPKVPAAMLVALGVLMVVGPIFGGLFAKTAAGKQMIDAFAPDMQPDALARYDTDLQILRGGASGVEAIYTAQRIPPGRFSRLDAFRSQWPVIDRRASNLLGRVRGTEADYRRVARIGGLDRIPFLIVICGIVAVYGGCVLLAGARSRAKPTILLVSLIATVVAVVPTIGNLGRGADAGHRMLRSLGPIMNATEVRQLQSDFVVIVEAVGELDTGFRQVPQSGAAATAVGGLVQQWPKVSSDLASLVGTVNDNIHDFDALNGLDRVAGRNVSGLRAFPWVLAGVGFATAGLAMASWPRRLKEAP